MGSREFEYEPEAICDGCGAKGAFDIYGDYFCDKCLSPKKKSRPTVRIRNNDDGELDEIVSEKCTLHLERIDENDYELVVCTYDEELHVTFLACKSATVTLTSG